MRCADQRLAGDWRALDNSAADVKCRFVVVKINCRSMPADGPTNPERTDSPAQGLFGYQALINY